MRFWHHYDLSKVCAFMRPWRLIGHVVVGRRFAVATIWKERA